MWVFLIMNIAKCVPLNIDVEKLLGGCESRDIAKIDIAKYKARFNRRQQKALEWRKTHREYLTQWMREYRQRRHDYFLDYYCKRYAANRDTILQRQRDYRMKNHDEFLVRHRKYQAKYREINREKVNARARDLYARTREKRQARARELYQENHADRIEKLRIRREKNRDKINARMREWCAANRDELNAKARQRDHERRQSQEYRDKYNAKKRAYRARKKAEKAVAASQQNKELNLNSNSKTENKDT